MKKKIFLILFLFCPGLVISQNDQAAQDSIVSILKSRAQQGLEIMTKCHIPGLQIVDEAQASKNKFIIGDNTFTVSVDEVFFRQFDEDGLYGILKGITSGVREECHSLDCLKAYAMLEKMPDIKADDVGLYQGIYISEDDFLLIRIEQVIPCFVLKDVIPEEFQQATRFKIYIFPSSKEAGTQVLGIYSLLDEWNAYYHGLRAAFELNRYVRNDVQQTDMNWSLYYMNFFSEINAYPEFEIYILEYLKYCEENANKVYKTVMGDADFRRAFRTIKANYTKLLDDFVAFRTENFDYLESIGIKADMEKDILLIGDKKVSMPSKENKQYEDYLEGPQFDEVRKDLNNP